MEKCDWRDSAQKALDKPCNDADGYQLTHVNGIGDWLDVDHIVVDGDAHEIPVAVSATQ